MRRVALIALALLAGDAYAFHPRCTTARALQRASSCRPAVRTQLRTAVRARPPVGLQCAPVDISTTEKDSSSEKGPGTYLKPQEGAKVLSRRLAQVLVSQWLLVPIALAIAKALSLDILSTVSITGMDIGYGVLGALPVAGVMALLEITQWGWVQRISERTRTFLITLLGKDGGGIFGLFFALGVGIAAGVGEELMFRGLLQGGLQRYLSTEAAVAASAVVFGLLHAVTPMYAVCAGITGAYFSLLWLWSGNLVVPIVAHAVYDIGAMLLLSLQLRGESSAQGTSAAPPVATETTTLK